MKIDAITLQRMVWNARLFTDKKSPAGPVALFTITDGYLRILSTDGHVALDERSPEVVETGPGWDVYVPLERLKELDEFLRTNTNSGGEYSNLDGKFGTGVDCPDKSMWGEFIGMSDQLAQLGARREAVSFAVRFERWRLLSRIRTGGDYPIDFSVRQIAGRIVVGFKAGPHIRGFIAPLDRSVVASTFPDQDILW